MNILKFVIICLLLSLFSCASRTVDIVKPNIIFLLADDMGYSDCQVFGQEKFVTPHIDQMAKEGMIFTDFYAGAPVCGPSRSVLMTGQHTGHTTVRGNMTMQGGIPGRKGDRVVYRANLLDDDITVGDVMQKAGYNTGLVGKWHLGGFDSTATPLDRGFNYFRGWLTSLPETYSSTYWPDKRFVNGEMKNVERNAHGKKGYYHTDMCTDEAIEYMELQEASDAPFMLMVCYSNPHAPLDAPDDAIYGAKPWADDNKTYASMLYHLDKSVKRIKDYLVKSGLSDNTIVIFTSDNGPRSNYSQELTDVVDFFNSNGDLRGYKRDLYEGGIRVPMIAWSPSIIPASSKSDHPFYFADVMPTFADIGAYTKELSTDGVSFYSDMLGRSEACESRFLYWEFFERGYKQAVRYGQWKAVVIAGKLELYDLSVDVGETENVASKYPLMVNEIKQYLSSCRSESEYWLTN